jgi:hypothetical protein
MISTDRQKARNFGIGSLILLGAIALWLWLRKDLPHAGAAVGGLAALLLVAGLAAPGAALFLRRGWMLLGHVLGRINGTILLVVIFLVVLTPVSVLRRLLARRPRPGWEPHEPRARDHFDDPY